MGEFERSGMGQEKGIAWAVRDVATPMTLAIAVVAALIGYGIVEALRNKSK